MIHGRCPSCSYRLQFSDDFAGKKVLCPKCQEKVLLPGGAPPAPPPLPVGCPRCRAKLNPPPALAGQVIECGRCKQQIQLPPAGVLPAVVQPERPRRRRDEDRPPAKPSAFGPASLALGIVSLLLLFIPCLWDYMIVVAAVGFLAGIIALIEDSSSATAWVGAALSGVSGGLVLMLANALAKAFAR
jgi:energy-converting hydrogenase Eha subunit A